MSKYIEVAHRYFSDPPLSAVPVPKPALFQTHIAVAFSPKLSPDKRGPLAEAALRIAHPAR
jgi:hypothetical protein